MRPDRATTSSRATGHPGRSLRRHPCGAADGSWSAFDEVERLVEPDDLAAALDSEPGARTNWDGLPGSTKQAILEWISTARAESTRQQRVLTTAAEAAEGRRANQWRQPKG
ncbi:YdeI/OmpD-associated family protein [Lacisediminihabitans sp.]|jgi:uncharacterized protein YdeI (YjbR/CyaY-like superfamily)|uniref:YdeI/OmpD-associated family protein n=1 Tax=Lacisediminihabitans sp. TaxID=2787631 RepID=UPI0039C9CF7D